MKDSKGFNKIIEGIVGSYESKEKMVTSLMRQVDQKIKDHHTIQELMLNKLRDLLAKNEFLKEKGGGIKWQ